MSMGVNHLGHFLLTQLLMSDLEKAKNARCIIVGSITGNSNTLSLIHISEPTRPY